MTTASARRRTIRQRRTIAAAAAALAAGLLTTSTPAFAEDDGLWYYDVLNVQAAHDAGYTGKGVTIAVIDGGIDTEYPELSDADITVHPTTACEELTGDPAAAMSDDHFMNAHGSAVVAVLVGNGTGVDGLSSSKGVAPGARILFYGLDDRVSANASCSSEGGRSPMAIAIRHAIEDGADVITTSIGSHPSFDDYDAVAEAYAAGIPIFASLPNNPGEPTFARANSVIGVRAIDRDAVPHGPTVREVAVTAPGVDVVVPGPASDGSLGLGMATGSSIATPITAGFVAVAMQKFPDATPWQIVQALFRTTGAAEHDLERDGDYGYGVVSLTALLASDPTAYPDEHPRLAPLDDTDASPATADLLGIDADATETAAPPAAGGDTAPPAGAASILLPALIGGGVLLALLLIGGIILLIVLLRRRTTTTTPPPPPYGEAR